MPTNYQAIAAENTKRYGTDIDEYGPVLLSNRYSDRTHFVYELLQNAEDAIGWRLERENDFQRDVTFEVSANGLVFRHCGLEFSEEHVRGICSIAKGTKRRDVLAIGKFGIGFKSVYAYTRHPEIHSGDEHFLIDSFVRPRGVAPRPVSRGETRFFLPFDHSEVSADKAYNEIAGRMRGLGLGTLLFLRNIESIAWTLSDGTSGQYLREARPLREGIDRVTLVGQGADGRDVTEEWLVFRQPVAHDGQPAGVVEVAFQLSHDKKSDVERIVRVSESPLVVFFPTEKETHLGFLIQGPYRTTPSRDNIPKDDAWNKRLAEETAKLVVGSLGELRERKLLTVSALESLIIDLQKYEPGAQVAIFRPIAESIVTALKNDRLIPAFRGGHVAGVNACIARAESLRSLLSNAQLAEITGSKTGWVTSEITRDRAPTLRAFLVETVGVKEFDAEAFFRELPDDFLKAQSDVWIAKFYEFLLGQQAILRQWWFTRKAIVRLRNGSHVAPFDPDGAPNAYLPGSGHTGFPTVKKTVCKGEARNLLIQLGLTQPDPVDDVVKNVLPRYGLETNEIRCIAQGSWASWCERLSRVKMDRPGRRRCAGGGSQPEEPTQCPSSRTLRSPSVARRC